MYLDFDLYFYYWGEFFKSSAEVYTFLFKNKIHPNTDIRHQNLSPSKVVTFLYVGTCLWIFNLKTDISQFTLKKIGQVHAKYTGCFWEFSRKKKFPASISVLDRISPWLIVLIFFPIEQAVKEGQLQFKPTTEGVLGKPVDLPFKYRYAYVNKNKNCEIRFHVKK